MMPSVVLTLTKAFLALKMGNLTMYEHEMQSYKEVKYAKSMSCSCFTKSKAIVSLRVAFYSKRSFQSLLFPLICCVGSTECLQ